MIVDVDCVHVDHVEHIDAWLDVVDDVGVDDVGRSQVEKVDGVDEVVGKVKDLRGSVHDE